MEVAELKTRVPVDGRGDVFEARRVARELAEGEGFGPKEAAEIETAVSELATNIVRHAGSGEIVVEAGEGRLTVMSRDEGPGIEDVDTALADGPGDGEGLGIGLGSVSRMMDDFVVSSEPGEGTEVVVEKYLESGGGTGSSYVEKDFPLRYGVATEPAEGSRYNGDAYVVEETGDSVVLAVIDGLGHGLEAFRASRKAADFIHRHLDLSPKEMVEGCDREISGTRGVVMSVVRIRPGEESLVYSGVGNIRTRVLDGDGRTPVPVPGIVGYNLDGANRIETCFGPGDTLVAHSDGISSRTDLGVAREGDPQEVAEELLRLHGRPGDDRTVAVVRWED